ncbi:hypothetical protein TSOC_007619 [Tetrabaena socialis]|uniref:Zinc metalloprotease EGY1, chloroplastic n=1 Tax=Tetrabaena socialis TaxID=47790 RepID=A0A2J8A0J7_9CHLO|nr:hypothetical protein TSOC_007619 [Tetrabaena socialis]|eukprot:PNH06053.1 hypothetical protein TSOC_007619 [Tetrabaena socialis]
MKVSCLPGRVAPITSSRCHRLVLSGVTGPRGRCALLVRASGSSDKVEEAPRIKRTMEGLDALLGIDPNDPTPGSPSSAKASTAVREPSAPADAARSAAVSTPSGAGAAGANGASGSGAGAPSDDQFQKIIEKARQLADAQRSSKPGNVEAQQQQLRQEFETLLQSMSKGGDMLGKEDLKRLRETAFGPQTFWVTETMTLTELDKTGILVRGNLRDSREKVFEHVCAKVAELFGEGKFEVIMIEDEQQPAEGEAIGKAALYGPRVAFQIVPAAQAQPPQSNNVRQVAAVVLFLLFAASSLQLSLVANITKLPRETLEFFANPDNFNSEVVPPGLENWDPTSYFVTAVPIFISLLGISFSHEIGHRIAAAVRNVKLGPTYFIPNLTLGSFGSITPFTSLLKGRGALWDVSAAGPLAGAMAAATVLALGLLQSQAGALPKELLIPVPTAFFQSSLLLGTAVKAALGDQVRALALSSFFTYVGLGLGLLGSSLSLPFGLYVIICQRTAEKYIQDNVSPVDDAKRTATAVAVLAAILVLVPMAPEVAQSIGVGRVDNFF